MSGEAVVRLKQIENYQFAIHFNDQLSPFMADEPPPLGQSLGPSPAQLLVAGVANCLSDSLLFALRKFKQFPEPIETLAKADIGRNADNRLRVLAIHVHLKLGVPAENLEHLDRVLSQFQDFCTVSSSLHPFIPVHVTVEDSLGSIVLSPA